MQIMLPVAYYYKSGFIDKPLMKYVVHSKSYSHSGGADRKLELLNGYEIKRFGIIMMMDIDENEKTNFINKISIVYHKLRLEFAFKNNRKKLLKEEYHLLKKSKANSFQDSKFYLQGCNPRLYGVYGKLISLFKSKDRGEK